MKQLSILTHHIAEIKLMMLVTGEDQYKPFNTDPLWVQYFRNNRIKFDGATIMRDPDNIKSYTFHDRWDKHLQKYFIGMDWLQRPLFIEHMSGCAASSQQIPKHYDYWLEYSKCI